MRKRVFWLEEKLHVQQHLLQIFTFSDSNFVSTLSNTTTKPFKLSAMLPMILQLIARCETFKFGLISNCCPAAGPLYFTRCLLEEKRRDRFTGLLLLEKTYPVRRRHHLLREYTTSTYERSMFLTALPQKLLFSCFVAFHILSREENEFSGRRYHI